MAVQDQMGERNAGAEPPIVFRIGINIGDIIIDGGDIFGDGVNIAARPEGIAERAAFAFRLPLTIRFTAR